MEEDTGAEVEGRPSNSGILGCCQNHFPILSFLVSSLQGVEWSPVSAATSEQLFHLAQPGRAQLNLLLQWQYILHGSFALKAERG